MYPEKVIRFSDTHIVSQDYEFVEVTSDERTRLFSYIEDNHFLNELGLLYKSFAYQVRILDSQYSIQVSGRYSKKSKGVHFEDDEVAIDTLFSNILSSAKTFLDMLDAYCRSDFYLDNEIANGKIVIPPKSKEKTDFKNYISKIYDSLLSYRLALVLRNLSQHGYQIISVDNKRVYIDIEKLTRARHFNMKKEIENELVKLKEDIYTDFDEIHAYLLFAQVRMEFIWAIHRIYHEFMTLRVKIARHREEIKNLIEQKCKNSVFGFFGFLGEDNMMHLLPKRSKYTNWIEEEIENSGKELKKIVSQYQKAFPTQEELEVIVFGSTSESETVSTLENKLR